MGCLESPKIHITRVIVVIVNLYETTCAPKKISYRLQVQPQLRGLLQ